MTPHTCEECVTLVYHLPLYNVFGLDRSGIEPRTVRTPSGPLYPLQQPLDSHWPTLIPLLLFLPKCSDVIQQTEPIDGFPAAEVLNFQMQIRHLAFVHPGVDTPVINNGSTSTVSTDLLKMVTITKMNISFLFSLFLSFFLSSCFFLLSFFLSILLSFFLSYSIFSFSIFSMPLSAS